MGDIFIESLPSNKIESINSSVFRLSKKFSILIPELYLSDIVSTLMLSANKFLICNLLFFDIDLRYTPLDLLNEFLKSKMQLLSI